MLLSILIPVYNNLELTKQVLRSIEKNIFTNDYYMNIYTSDFIEAFNPDIYFSYYEISKCGTDFRFVGVKK